MHLAPGTSSMKSSGAGPSLTNLLALTKCRLTRKKTPRRMPLDGAETD